MAQIIFSSKISRQVLALSALMAACTMSVGNAPAFAKGNPPPKPARPQVMRQPAPRPQPQQFRAQVTKQAQMQRPQPMQQFAGARGPGQVLRRDANINQRINNAYGHLGGQYGHLERQDQSVQQQAMRDVNRNGGYLTNGQSGQLNREETDLSRETYFDNQNNSFVQNHPRRSQVLSRDANIGYSINKDEGHLGGHYNQLNNEDNAIARQEQSDARRNGGFITAGQQGQLNREETALRNQTKYDNTNNPFVQNHPRRSEVLGRDANLNYAINKDEGHLSGQYGTLNREDHQIVQQEQADARANGGWITTQQQQQLNQEENQLRNQIQQDNTH
jgi:hypothetical protein